MAKWIRPLEDVASSYARARKTSRSLEDEEVVRALMEKAGIEEKKKKPSFLQRLSGALSALEWSDDLLKTMKQGGNVGDFAKSYLTDIPKTIYGALAGDYEALEPNEGRGVELMEYLGIESPIPKFILGTAADILEPSMFVSGALKAGSKLTKTGASFVDDLAKIYAEQGAKGAAKKLGAEFGEGATESALKRMELGEDALSIANDYLVKQGAQKGLVETIEPGLYLGTSAKKGKLIAKGTIPSYIGKMIENPLLAPVEVGANALVKTGLDQTKTVNKLIKRFDDSFLKRFDFQHELKRIGEPTLTRLGSKAHGINVASEYAASEAVKDLQKTFEGLPKEQVAKLIDIDRRRIVESAAGLPQKTTVERVLKNLSNSALTKKEYEEIVGRMSKEMKETPLEIVGRIMDEGQKVSTKGPTGQLIQEGFEPLNLEQVFGTKAYNLIKEQWEEAKNYTKAWEELAQEIGYKSSDKEFARKVLQGDVTPWFRGDTEGRTKGLINLADDRASAGGYALASEGLDFQDELKWGKSLENINKIEKNYVKEYYPLVKKTLNIDENGIRVIQSLDPKGNRWAKDIVESKDLMYWWRNTRREKQEAWEKILIPQLKKLGHDSIKYKDDFHNTLAVFSPEQLKTKEELVNILDGNEGRFVETLDDVKAFKEAIENSNLDKASKEYYTKFVANTMEENIKNLPHREALGLGSFDAGYVPHVYNMEQAKELPDEGLFKRNLVDTKNRTFSTGVDVAMFNKYSPYKLEFETGASGLVKQIGHEAGQREAVKRVHDMYSVLAEQVQEGLMPRFGMEWQKGIPKYWKKTGVPMLDEMGIVADPKVWNTIKDTNKFLIGKQNFDDTLRLMNKLNSTWRGWTTAMTLNLGKGKELPVNPAYYVRNWMNNKLSAVLYGGMDPLAIPTRSYQATKVWKYIETGEGGDEAIGHLKVKDIAKDFINNGGLGGTNIEDIRQGMEINKTIGDRLSRISGSGDLARKIETTDKIMVFLDQKLKNVDSISAMDKVRFSLFDYTQLTDFEKDTVKPLFAFYSWNKKNFVSFFKTLAEDPNRIKIFDDIFKGLKQMSADLDVDIKEILPDYLDEAYAYYTYNKEKNQVGAVYGFGTNIEAVGDILQPTPRETAQGLISALSPMYRIGLEVATDYNYFKQKPISEDTSAYAYRNLPDSLKEKMGIEGSTFTDDSGKEVTTYKMNPMTKYAIENIRPINSLLKFFNIVTDEGLSNEMFLDFLNYVSGVRYQQYDTEYLRRQYENERFKKRMQMLMDEGYVNEYKNYYIPKDVK